jgi:hypothetical protein
VVAEGAGGGARQSDLPEEAHVFFRLFAVGLVIMGGLLRWLAA